VRLVIHRKTSPKTRTTKLLERQLCCATKWRQSETTMLATTMAVARRKWDAGDNDAAIEQQCALRDEFRALH
jgi:hypothetical protein